MVKRSPIMKLLDFIPDLFEQDYLIDDFLAPQYKKSKVIRKKK